ncbi:MAG: hypothetical protein R3C25_07130 [Hyphomonadaceae bacterium]
MKKKGGKKSKGRGSRGRAPVLSTSEARANFAGTIESAQIDNAVIGFDRYGQTVAALVPVEAVYVLAGQEHLVDPASLKVIREGARAFARSVPHGKMSASQIVAAAPKPKPRLGAATKAKRSAAASKGGKPTPP